MIIVDRALAARASAGNPIRVAQVGAGFLGSATINQLVNSVPGIELVAVANRHVERAVAAYREAGVADVDLVDDVAGLERAIAAGRHSATGDAMLVCRAEGVDAIIDVTGAVGFGARVAVEAIDHGKHMILLNAELDGTLGPILKVRADAAGVIFTGADGDQPVVQMNLFRFVRGLGVTPLLCGNIKGLQDRFRNPTTQEGFARQWGQDPHMVTSFADGTKISFEQAIVANATEMTIAQRGMTGADHRGHVDELTEHYDVDELQALGGVVDYVVGAQPGPGVFVLGTHEDPLQRHMLDLYKLGKGPLYSFYTPYHLCHFETPSTVARAVIFGDAAMSAAGPPRVDVVATAKTALVAGQVLDGLGGYDTYGQCETAEVTARERLLPIGLAEGCRVRRDLPVDRVLTYDDVEVPPGRLEDELRAEQSAHFAALAV